MRQSTRTVYRQRERRGAIFIDALVGVFVLALGAAAFFSLLPTVQRSEIIARDESTAQHLANRMIEQVQLLRPADATASTLAQLNLIDAGQAESPYSFTNIPLDEASRYSPSEALPEGAGTLTVEDIDSNSVLVTVEITWQSPSGRQNSIRTGTVLGGHR